MVLIAFSPVVSGKTNPLDPEGPTLSMIKNPAIDFSLFPLDNPGIVSIPLAFLLGIIGTLTGKPEADHEVKATEMEVRSLTGAGAERASAH